MVLQSPALDSSAVATIVKGSSNGTHIIDDSTSREVSKDQCMGLTSWQTVNKLDGGSNSFQRRCRCSGIATQLQTGTTTCVDDQIQPPLKRQCLRDTTVVNGVCTRLITLLFGDLINSLGDTENNNDVVKATSRVCIINIEAKKVVPKHSLFEKCVGFYTGGTVDGNRRKTGCKNKKFVSKEHIKTRYLLLRQRKKHRVCIINIEAKKVVVHRPNSCEPGYVQVTYDVSENGNTRRLKYTTFQMHTLTMNEITSQKKNKGSGEQKNKKRIECHG
ncbi:hypothetical protein Tco_0861974 [Tanacetum coccineum]